MACTASSPAVVATESVPVQDTVSVLQEDTIVLVEEPILPYRASETRTMDLIHTKLELSFDWEKQWVIGKATLELKPYYYPQAGIILDANQIGAAMLGGTLCNKSITAECP